MSFKIYAMHKQMPRRWRGNGGRKTEIAMGDCVIKSDLDRLGEEREKRQSGGIGDC